MTAGQATPMDETAVVTVFLRHDCDVLLLRRSEAVGSYSGRWGAVAGHAEGDADAAARQEIREETGIDPDESTTLVRRGDPFDVEDADLDTRWVVHPYLFDCETREVRPNEETTTAEWAPPTAILRRETVPDLWTSYDRVRPGVEAVASDREHGSAYLSLRALEVLRDEAALAVTRHGDARDWQSLLGIARDLATARESMPVVRTRVDRAATAAIEGGETPERLEAAADAGLERALAADRRAASIAADRLEGARIVTLSRSGTVRQAIVAAEPAAVLVAESRPGGEGIGVAEDLADRLDCAVWLTTDAALAHRFVSWNADALVVGADAILGDGRVVNKVGTRGAAIAAAHDGTTVAVVAASDKITPAVDPDLEERDRTELTDDESVVVANPTFDLTPGSLVDVVVTERGVLGEDGVVAVADEHRDLATWRR